MAHGGDTRMTPQETLNESYDWLLSLLGVSLWGYDGTEGTSGARRIAVNSSGELEVNVKSNILPTDAATSTAQIELNSLTDTLQELVQRLTPLAGAVANNASLRIVGVSMPSTAVTGPITSAQSIAEKNAAGVSYPEKMALDNLTATITNINNCVGA